MSPVLEKANCLGSVLNYPFPLFTGKTSLIEITRKAIFTVAYSPVMSCVTLPAGSSLRMSSGVRKATMEYLFYSFLAKKPFVF